MTEVQAHRLPVACEATEDINYSSVNKDIQLILSVFDTDKTKGVLSVKEIGDIFNYLKALEKGISMKGEKGDKIISELDFAKAIEKTKKFDSIRTQLNRENIQNIARASLHVLYSLVLGHGTEGTVIGGPEDYYCPNDNHEHHPIIANIGDKYTTYKHSAGGNKPDYMLVKSNKGKNVDIKEAAKALGLESEFSILKFKTVYSRSTERATYKYEWDENKKQFSLYSTRYKLGHRTRTVGTR
jgi:hypothetical protein